MPRKNTLKSYPIINAGNMTGDLTSSVTSIQFLDNIGLQISWTSSPVGTFSAQVSADYSPGGANNTTANSGHWTTLTLTYWDGAAQVTSTTIPTSVGSPIYLDLSLLSAPYIRLIYTAGSSSGTCTALITAKEV